MAITERRKQLIDTADVLINLIRCIRQRRALQNANPKPHLNFWIIINNSLFDTAILDWCKLFGSDDEERQPTHWKNVLPEQDHRPFRNGLHTAAGVSAKEWDAYWREVKTYRDKAVAHRDRGRRDIKVFPRHELALKSAYFYYSRVRQLLLEEFDVFEPEDLKAYANSYSDQADIIAAAAVAATASLREGVD